MSAAAGAIAAVPPRAHRGTIHLEEGAIVQHTRYEARQYVLRVAAPRTASRATPGSFVHLRCDARLPMRRPLSIMRADLSSGWIEVLYKVTGEGTAALAEQPVGASISVLGPIGQGFTLHPERARVLAIGGGVGIPPMVFLAEYLRGDPRATWKPLVLM